MKKLSKVIWGIIGAGDVCEVKSTPAMYSIENSEVKMVMRRNAAKASDFAKRHGILNWTTNLEELLNDPVINAVYIATPPSTHAELTIKCAEAGKAIYVEKPMANTYAECLSMMEACHKADVPLFVAYYRRALPGFLKVKEILESNVLGDIRCVNIEMYQACDTNIVAHPDTNWRVIPEIAGGGYFNDLASHQFDYLDFLFGPVVETNGFTANQGHLYPADDIVSATFRFQNGIIGTGLWCFTTDTLSEKDSIRIVGSKGELTFNTFGSPMMIRIETTLKGNEEFIFNHSQPIQKPLIQLVVDELCDRGFSPSTGTNGSRTTLIMEKITSKRL